MNSRAVVIYLHRRLFVFCELLFNCYPLVGAWLSYPTDNQKKYKKYKS